METRKCRDKDRAGGTRSKDDGAGVHHGRQYGHRHDGAPVDVDVVSARPDIPRIPRIPPNISQEEAAPSGGHFFPSVNRLGDESWAFSFFFLCSRVPPGGLDGIRLNLNAATSATTCCIGCYLNYSSTICYFATLLVAATTTRRTATTGVLAATTTSATFATSATTCYIYRYSCYYNICYCYICILLLLVLLQGLLLRATHGTRHRARG
jgi:hypothetical protein